jgi:hypothetical protein
VALRQQYDKPIFDDLEIWLKEQLDKISGKTPLAKAIHAIVDNYAAHKHEKVPAWLTRHPLLDPPLYPDIQLLAQRCGRLLRQTDEAAVEKRCLPFPHRPSSCNQPFHHRVQ